MAVQRKLIPTGAGRRLLLAGAGAAAAVLLLVGGRTAWRFANAVKLVRASTPFQRPLAQPGRRLLVVGDSTAVGTGASAPQHSLAGLLAQADPDLAVENRGADGATFADLPRQLDGHGRVHTVLVQAGGNDVLRLRDLDTVRADIDAVLRAARQRADRVVLMPAGNVGNAPFFWPPVSWLMTGRARRLHRHARELAARHGAVYVNLFRERDDDPFVQQPELNAADGLHPSDAGYRVWYAALRAQAPLE